MKSKNWRLAQTPSRDMNVQQLVESFPNGLHDAELLRFEMDYCQRILTFELDIWVGYMHDKLARETYRRGVLTVERVGCIVIEPPDPDYDWISPGPVTIDVGDGIQSPDAWRIPEIPVGHTFTWMYIGTNNSFLHFSGGDASFEWTGDAENRAKSAR